MHYVLFNQRTKRFTIAHVIGDIHRLLLDGEFIIDSFGDLAEALECILFQRGSEPKE